MVSPRISGRQTAVVVGVCETRLSIVSVTGGAGDNNFSRTLESVLKLVVLCVVPVVDGTLERSNVMS